MASHHSLLKIFSAISIVVLFIPLNSSSVSGSPTSLPGDGLQGLTQGWQYRWGDSPKSEQGTFLWARGDNRDPQWREISALFNPPGRGEARFIWYRIRLPEEQWIHPSLCFPPVIVAFEAYLDGRLIYRFGDMKHSDANKLSSTIRHMIPLENNYRGKLLAIRVYSDVEKFIGVSDIDETVWIGSQNSVFKTVINANIDGVILGFLFLFAGVLSTGLFLKRLRRKEYFLLSFGIFTVCAGIFYIIQAASTSFLFDYPRIRYYLGYIAFLLFPVGLYAFLENVIGAGEYRLFRRLWQIHLLFTGIALLLDLTRVMYLPVLNLYYLILFIFTILATIYVCLKEISRGSREARIFIIGFTIFGIFGLIDILTGLNWIPYWHWLSHWGALIFILLLGYLLEQRFTENQIRLEVYSKKLEMQTRKLDKYSQILEQKVAERTRDLHHKNRELQKTLAKLTTIQSQLIMKEKLASLGHLVAGVAHEVNNPIGAVRSAADVSKRCIQRIGQMVTQNHFSIVVPKKSSFQKTLTLLGENNRVIVDASQRITKLVEDLRDFARLDKAEYQKYNLRQGMDSTLALLASEFHNRIKIVKEYEEIPEIYCYPGQLNQVFMNVLKNAVQSIKGAGEIIVRIFSDAENIRLRITDSGRGIPAEKLDNLFEFTFSETNDRVKMGSGLSIAYHIVQEHHGTIEVDSQAGKGTTVTIILPVRQQNRLSAP